MHPDLFHTTPPDVAQLFAQVIIPLALPRTYTYAVPTEWINQIQVGCRVEVVLGKSKRYAGLVKQLSTETPPYPTKPIENILDEEPILFPIQLQLWEWISQYYLCTEGDVMAAALPAHFKLSSETQLIFNEAFGDEFSMLDNNEFLLAEALLLRKQLSITEVQQILDLTHVYPVVKRLIDKQVCQVWETLTERYKAKLETMISLHPQFHSEAKLAELMNEWSRAPKQLDILLSYLHLAKTEGSVSQVSLLKKSGGTAASLNGLLEKKILIAEKRAVDRINTLPLELDLNIDLSEAQSVALQQLQEQLTQKPVCLLHGVTGSGKTQLFIRLMEQYFTAGKQVLYLLPEIALTAQMIRRLQAHFGGHIAIYHSKFSDNERVELWHKVRKGTVRIVLGARSALFLPFHDLGLIVVDEEHDPSFKQQEPAPRYHARDAAIYYGQLTGARVVLGSATPSLESYFHATRGKFGLVALLERFGGIQLPEIEFVNTRFLPSRGKVMISPRLREAMEKAIAAKKQVILFQNRRGYTPYLTCGTCGYIPQCQQCDVTLTFHKQSNKLQCHYCGTSYPKLVACPACGTVNWKDSNFGTEKIEEYLTKELADMRVARMDMDTIRGKHAHDQLIRQFEQGKVDVLVGTQMVVKGLDFEQVSLVGILDADSMLHFADFRVHERAFQLMEQVSGRAGRKSEQGKVLIQTAYPQHPVLQWVKQHDYVAFFEQEIGSRQQYHYPPFTRIIHIMVRHKDRMLTEQAADVLADLLRKDLGDRVMGPSVPVISRVRNQYRMELQIKLPLNQQFIQQAKQLIRNAQGLLQAETRFRSVIITPDVDPV